MSLSVVISSHNRPSPLRRAAESALGQVSVDEVIVVDDASRVTPDLSGLDVGRIRLECHKANLGVCAVRNTGLSLVRTDYVAFLDDDDRLLPDAFQPLLDAPHDGSTVAAGVVVVERKGVVVEKRRPPSSSDGQIWGLDAILLRGGERSFYSKQSAVYSTQILRRLGGWNEDLRSRSATELFFRICTRYAVLGVDHPVYALSRGANDHLTNDRELWAISYQYLLDNYGELLADPERYAYFERSNRARLRRSSKWYRAVHGLAELLEWR
jgi:glycosyltransferase involved in cell wall biosynthesis